MSFLYRDHHGGFAESMATTQTFNTFEELHDYLSKGLRELSPGTKLESLTIDSEVIKDDRNGWNSQLVTGKVTNLVDPVVFGYIYKPESPTLFTHIVTIDTGRNN